MIKGKEKIMNTKSTFVSIVGRANVGKSSLLNSLVGEKIAAVSAKPQTTRTKITGVLTKGNTQFVFIDTPGMHKAKTRLSEHMVKIVNDSVSENDISVLVVDCTKSISDNEKALINDFKSAKVKAILALNKTDLVENKDLIISKITEYTELFDFEAVIPMSIINKDGIDTLLDEIEKLAVEAPHFFPDDMLTDQPEKVIAAEIIREKMLNLLNDEVPHGIAVGIESMKERDTSNSETILDIEAIIYCERDSHKGIVIGKGGAMLKKIGQLAREELEDFFRIRVNLQCWVKVKEGWRNREGIIKNFGLSN